ncbi:MAG: carboxypeptidase regulatory-like domain-containing protein [Terriglobia bacterium]
MKWMRFSTIVLLAFLAWQGGAKVKASPPASDLRLVITIEQPAITAPFPARVTLHLHNSGRNTLWLYRPVSPQKPIDGKTAPDASQTGLVTRTHSVEGPTLSIQINPEDSTVTTAGNGEVLKSAGLPRPKLIRLAAGDDFEEKSVIHLAPAWTESNGKKEPIWGRYKFSVTYAAKYSNGDELDRILGVKIWQGAVQSNTLEIELLPPVAAARGSVAGTITGSDNTPRSDVLVSLSDQEERLLDQTTTDFDGKFSFTHLPPGLYWATVRRTDFTVDTVVFRHVVLSSAEPAGTLDFVLTPPETYLPKQMLHKPVLFRVKDGAGAGLGNVSLDITWSSGTVLDSVTGRTSDDGTAAVELIPGRNYVSLKRGGCPEDDERMDVAPGPGIDGFKVVFDCTKK